MTVITQTLDDTTCLCLLVTWFINMKVPDNPLPADIAYRGGQAMKREWDARGYQPENVVQAGLMYAAITWTSMLEIDRLKWMAKLLEVCQ